jgi:dUTPase
MKLRSNNPSSGQQQMPAAQVLLHGLKAEFHLRYQTLKLQKHVTDAGMDLFATSTEPECEVIGDTLFLSVHTMVGITPPIGTFGFITSRSSTKKNLHGVRVRNGVIDAGYTGEILVILETSIMFRDAVVGALMKCAAEEIAIAQILILPALAVIPVLADEAMLAKIRQHSRGDSGFGSTDGMHK